MLDATGLSVIFGIIRCRRSGALRFDRARRDLLALAAFHLGRVACCALAIVVPLMFAAGYALQTALLNRALGRNILPPLLITFGLSMITFRMASLKLLADTRFLNVGPLQGASLPLGGGIDRRHAADLSACGNRRDRGAQRCILSHRGRSGISRTSDDVEIAQLMGINNKSIYALTMGIALAVCAIAGFFLGARANFDLFMKADIQTVIGFWWSVVCRPVWGRDCG